ncbi:MAG: hypothetical protein ACKVP3_05660 [Hyphomicrobiaceae bacterium]
MEDQYVDGARSVFGSLICINKVGSDLVKVWNHMVSGRMTSRLLQQTLAELLAKRPQTAEERLAIDAAIAAVVRGMQSAETLTESAPAPTAAVLPVKTGLHPNSPFYGLGLREACPKRLRLLPPKTEQTAREIWDALALEGFQTAHKNPVHAVNDAMRRRAKTHNDVLLVGAGKWGLKSWYSEAELEQIRKSVGGMGGRDKVAHSAATTKGMLVAVSRGVRLGAASKLTPQQSDQLIEAARSGHSKEELAKQFGISTASVTNYVKRLGYNSVRELRREGRKLQAPDSTEEDPGTRH